MDADDSWISTKALDGNGQELEDCVIAGDKELLDRTLAIENKLIAENRWGSVYSCTPQEISDYLALEKRQSRRTAVRLLEEGVIPKDASAPIPVFYGPDSGLHTAEGVLDGLYCASNLKTKLFPIRSKQSLPQEAIDMVSRSGVLVICDSTTYSGRSVKKALEKLPKDLKGPDGNPIKVVTYFNYAFNADMSKDSSKCNELQQPAQFKAAAAPHQVYFIANAVGGWPNSLFDRADGMARVAETKDPKLQSYVDKFHKPGSHRVGEWSR